MQKKVQNVKMFQIYNFKNNIHDLHNFFFVCNPSVYV